MSVTESKENYLEIIYILSLKNAQVRAIDIANYLGFSRASVSIALKLLKDANLSIGLVVRYQVSDVRC